MSYGVIHTTTVHCTYRTSGRLLMDTESDDGYLVIGGGVAGSTCAIELLRLSSSSKVTLVSPSSTIKTLQDLEQISPLVGIVHVQDRTPDDFAAEHPAVVFVCDEVESVDATRSQAKFASGRVFHFSRCCVATGASPALAYPHPRVFGIRDTESVETLCKRLVDAKRVLIVGNGGIALELVHSLVSTQACQVVWAVRSSYVGNTFFDASASTFFLQNGKETARSGSTTKSESGTPRKHFANGQNFEANISGSSVGPDWVKTFQEVATHKDSTRSRQPLLDVQFGCELGDVCNGNTREDSGIGVRWPVSATLTNGVIVDCDFIVSATGVQPNTGVVGSEFERGQDGGLCVDELMRVVRSVDSTPTPEDERADDEFGTRGGRVEKGGGENNIFAAGDCCCLEWPKRDSDHWFQVRLWRQARAMGSYAAKCMTDSVDELGSGGAFDLFVHATQFFGFKVALLGRFNGQGLGSSIQDFVSSHALEVGLNTSGGEHGVSVPLQCHHESIHIKNGGSNIQVLMRTTPGVEYIKVILADGRMRGAMLIGDTGLEETFENLILSGIDVSHIGDDLLSRDVDVEDFFD